MFNQDPNSIENKKTNLEMIRELRDENLTKILTGFLCNRCIYLRNCSVRIMTLQCTSGVKEWLAKEVDKEDWKYRCEQAHIKE